MARRVNRGEIWLYTFNPPNKRRPVVVLSPPEAIDLLDTVMVAPITSTVRGVPSEVAVGVDEGLRWASAVNLDHVETVDQHGLKHFVGSLDAAKMGQVHRALTIATGYSD